MTQRIYNFSAGPAILRVPVLERARDELLSLRGIGMSVMEVSHRSEHFAPVLAAAENGIRELLGVPENYHILFLQGGASLQFSMVPMNLLGGAQTADYVVTGAWGKKAVVAFRPTLRMCITHLTRRSRALSSTTNWRPTACPWSAMPRPISFPVR